MRIEYLRICYIYLCPGLKTPGFWAARDVKVKRAPNMKEILRALEQAPGQWLAVFMEFLKCACTYMYKFKMVSLNFLLCWIFN